MWLLLKNLLFTVLAPGTVTGLVPYWLVATGFVTMPAAWGPSQLLALVPAALGVAIYLWCLWDFAVFGRGTPAPVDPPKRLVARGLYRYVRNPMYVGVLTVLAGEAAFFQSWRLLLYAAAIFLMFHLFTVIYEEPKLLQLFGDSYERYRRRTNRWLPGRPGSAA